MMSYRHFLTTFFLASFFLISHSTHAQPQKPKVYIGSGSSQRYDQQQFDSLSRAETATDPDKVVMVMSEKELPEEIQLSFATMVIKSIKSVRRNWLDKKLPPFSFQDTTGAVYDNEKTLGSVVVLNMWSTTCHPCIEEISLLNALTDLYANRGVVFLAPAPETSAVIGKVLAKHPFNYTILPQAQALFRVLDTPGYPYHIVVDRDGYIRYIQAGTINSKTGKKFAEGELPDAIEQALK